MESEEIKNISSQLNIIENKPDENNWTIVASEDVLLSNFTTENYVFIYANMLKEENIEYVSYFEDKMIGSHKHPRYKATMSLYVRNGDFDKVMELSKEKGIYVLEDEPEELEEEIIENKKSDKKELELLPLNQIIEKIIMTMILLMFIAVDVFCIILLISDFGVGSIFLNLFMFGFTWLTIRIMKKGKFH